MSLELNPVFEAPGLQLGPVFDVSGPPTFVSFTATATGGTVVYSGAVTHYRVNGGAAIAIPASPFTFAGLSPNTEPHTVQLSGDGGSTWPASWTFGTLNPGTGGADAPTGLPPGIAESSELALALLQALPVGVAVESDTALALPLVLPPGVAVETSIAFALASSGTVQAAEELDEALPLALVSAGGPGVAVETDQALALLLIVGPGIAVETDTAVALSSPARQVPGAPRRRATNLSTGRRPANLA